MICPVRGHDHELVALPSLFQRGSGDEARRWECPSGRYRWTDYRGGGFSTALRSTRPRYGWSKDAPLYASAEEARSS